jgi:hypothetical protein
MSLAREVLNFYAGPPPCPGRWSSVFAAISATSAAAGPASNGVTQEAVGKLIDFMHARCHPSAPRLAATFHPG